ncbi:hypothetical protein BH09ACT11_BH09ACT11_05810 [soil metagenome]
MTDHDDAQIARLLAGARHDEPIPEHVAARMDEVLVGLVADRTAAADTAALDTARSGRLRRRRIPRVIAAAAAVLVVGGLGWSVADRSSDEMATTDAGAESAAVAESGSDLGEPVDPGVAEDGMSAGSDQARIGGVLSAPVPLSSTTFDADATALAEQYAVTSSAPAGGEASSTATTVTATGFRCGPANWPSGTLLPVVYDGSDAVLQVTGDAGAWEISLLDCETAEVLRRTTAAP